ncbi:hypothetical protein FRC11_001513 [Ceratobasidium sp. 423]|nr:hypothetical protein FRC11_001513 [Ceratobasidium sp. 423]
MLAVAPPPNIPLDHDRHIERPTSPVVQSPPAVFIGPVQPADGPPSALEELLKNPVEFKQGCSTLSAGVLAAGIPEGKYKAINDGPMSEDEDDQHSTDEKPSTPTPSKSTQPAETLFSGSLNMEWPAQVARHPGFNNLGNTCFLNSVLQCLLHTPPLLNILLDHEHDKTGFCMVCLLRDLARASFFNRKRGTGMIINNLNKIAKGMRQGRQEDAHEFLRYSVDALQRSALAIYCSTSSKHPNPNPNKIPHALAETSWVHTIFGGRLRSRVSCRTCHHCSDTFDSLLDLSVEINRSASLMHALSQFVKPEVLSGEDAYRCEKCKKPKGKRGADGRWTAMDDELVTSCAGPPLNHKNAYVLFYIQSDKARPMQANDDDDVFSSLGSQKRPRDDMESDGPRSGSKPNGMQVKTRPWDMFPVTKKSRIEDTTKAKQGIAGPSRPTPVGVASGLGRSLVNYGDSDDIEDEGEVVNQSSSTIKPTSPAASPAKPNINNSPPKPTSASTTPGKATPQPKPSLLSAPKASQVFSISPVKPSNFYGSSQKKDKHPGMNPYSGLSGSNNLHAKRDSSVSDIQKQMDASLGFHQFGPMKQPRAKERMKKKKSL